MTDVPAQEIIAQAVELTGFKESVVSYLLEEFLETENEHGVDFFGYLGELLGDSSFILAAAKGLNIDGCLAAYDYGYKTVTEGLFEDDLEGAIDDIELRGILSTED
jgi:hypothetical protein